MVGENTAIALTLAVDYGLDLRALAERIRRGHRRGPRVTGLDPVAVSVVIDDVLTRQAGSRPAGARPKIVTHITLQLRSIMCGPEAPGISQVVAPHDTDAAPGRSAQYPGHHLPVSQGDR